jgi:hypothetical protein
MSPVDSEGNIVFPFYQNELNDLFGDPYQAQKYLVTMDFSELAWPFAHVLDYEGNPWGHKIYGNYILQAPLRAALRILIERGLAGELRTYDGCFNIRQMKGGSGWSVHSWGLAFDLNAASNPFGGEPTLSPGFVKCFAECGFEWGGLWEPDQYRDGMHFQLPWIKDRTGPLAPVAWRM